MLYLLWLPMTFTTRARTRPHQLSLCKCKNPRKKWMSRLRSRGQVWPGILKAHHTYHRILPWGKKRSFQQKREWWEVHKNSLIPLHSEDQKSLCGGKIISLKLVIFFNCFVLIFSGLTPNLWYHFVLRFMGLIKLMMDILKIRFILFSPTWYRNSYFFRIWEEKLLFQREKKNQTSYFRKLSCFILCK